MCFVRRSTLLVCIAALGDEGLKIEEDIVNLVPRMEGRLYNSCLTLETYSRRLTRQRVVKLLQMPVSNSRAGDDDEGSDDDDDDDDTIVAGVIPSVANSAERDWLFDPEREEARSIQSARRASFTEEDFAVASHIDLYALLSDTDGDETGDDDDLPSSSGSSASDPVPERVDQAVTSRALLGPVRALSSSSVGDSPAPRYGAVEHPGDLIIRHYPVSLCCTPCCTCAM